VSSDAPELPGFARRLALSDRFGSDNPKYQFIDPPNPWFGDTVEVDWPALVSMRLDPFEPTWMFNGEDGGSIACYQPEAARAGGVRRFVA